MKNYIVTILYNFMAGREVPATIIIKAEDGSDAETKAVNKLRATVGNCNIQNIISFEIKE